MYTDANLAASPLRILLPVHHYLPSHSAGAELYTAKLAARLQQRGHVVEVVAIESTTHGAAGELHVETDLHEGVRVHRLSFNIDAAPDRNRWLFENPLLGDWFRNYCQSTAPDLVHFQGGYLVGVAPIIAAKSSGTAAALTLHDYWFICPRHTLLRGDGSLCDGPPTDPAMCAWCDTLMKRRYQVIDWATAGIVGNSVTQLNLLRRRDLLAYRRQRIAEALDQVDLLISPSNFMADTMAGVVDRRRIEVVRFGFDPACFTPRPAAAPDDELHFGFIGQVNEHKGVHLLVEAFRRLVATRPIALDIFGNIPVAAYQQRLEQLAVNDPRIHFHGRYENGRVGELLASLTVCVAPSTWYENSPLAIQEAQAAQTPVVTAALGGMQELVEDGVNGLLFAPRSVESLAAQLQRLIDSPQLLAELEAGARALRLRTVDDELDDLERLYRRIAPHRAPSVLAHSTTA